MPRRVTGSQRRGQLALALALLFGALSMHGLVTVPASANGSRAHVNATSVVTGVEHDDHHRDGHDTHPSWHGTLLCLWVLATAVALTLAHRRRIQAASNSFRFASGAQLGWTTRSHVRGPPRPRPALMTDRR